MAILLLLPGCRGNDDITYFLDFSADESQRASIAASFWEWERVTGTSAREVSAEHRAVIVFRVAPLEGEVVGLSTYSTNTEFDAESLSNISVLDRAEIVSEPEVWLRDDDGRVRHFNHEIGHVLTAGGHTETCPSTMHANSDSCGTETIDEEAAARARARIADGWLSRAEQIGALEAISP